MELQEVLKITAKSMALYGGVRLFPAQLAGYLFS
jgi:hypothetical protein